MFENLISYLPELATVATALVSAISIAGSFKNKLGDLKGQVSNKLDEAKNESKQVQSSCLELAVKIKELAIMTQEVLDLKDKVATLVDLVDNLKATNEKLTTSVQESVQYEVQKEKEAVASLIKDKIRLGGTVECQEVEEPEQVIEQDMLEN